VSAAAPDRAPSHGFAVGDQVRLNSSATVMTVRSVDGDKVMCRWFNDQVDLIEAEFHPRELTLRKRAGD
jgi:uncharacterized protein YodC (DUF2158 family)